MHFLIPSLAFTTSALLSLAPTSLAQNAANNTIVYPGKKGPGYDYTSFEQDQECRANGIVEMFRFGWDAYVKYAFPHDDLRPVWKNGTDSRNGWGVTPVDALDTAIIMEQTDIVKFILDFVPTIDFTKTNTPEPSRVSLFETNIRYIGGLLSAYDLLKGPFAHLDVQGAKVDALLSQAACLADALKFAFNTTSGIPVNWVFMENRTFADNNLMADGTQTAGLAEVGTLVLEWQHLSDLTGDPSYGALVHKAEEYWLAPSKGEVWPGLTGSNFSVDTGEIMDVYGGWTSGNDSAYEYLIKMYVYDPERYANFSDAFTKAADSTITHLLSHPSSRPDLTVAGVFTGKEVINQSDSLACFIGGSFILGSSALKRDDWLPYGLHFAEWCANGYRSTASGIGPYEYSWDLETLASPNFANQSDFYNRAGWFVNDNGEGILGGGQSPEAVESWYYAYQATGEQYWRDVAWAFTLAQNRTARVPSGGFTSIVNIFEADGGGVDPNRPMQSFVLAETLKYMYLVQTEKKGVWDVLSGEGKKNHFVFNTEAHPVKVAARDPV